MENISYNYCSCPTLTGIDDTYGECGACGPSGKRISKTVNDKTIYTICFDPTMDLDENGNIIARYIQNPNVLDEPISIETAQGKYYYLFDGLGSVTGLTDSGGNLVATYKYDAFGNILSETGDATLNAINPYRYTSRVYDKETGLYYYRARYYDANTGRFISKDPLRSQLTEGKHLYVYCENNPVNFVDPTGLLLGYWACQAIMLTAAAAARLDSDLWAHPYHWACHAYIGVVMRRAGCDYLTTYGLAWELEALYPPIAQDLDPKDVYATMWGWTYYNKGGYTYWWWIRTGYAWSAKKVALYYYPSVDPSGKYYAHGSKPPE